MGIEQTQQPWPLCSSACFLCACSPVGLRFRLLAFHLFGIALGGRARETASVTTKMRLHAVDMHCCGCGRLSPVWPRHRTSSFGCRLSVVRTTLVAATHPDEYVLERFSGFTYPRRRLLGAERCLEPRVCSLAALRGTCRKVRLCCSMCGQSFSLRESNSQNGDLGCR